MVFGVTTNKVTMNIHHTNNEVFTKNLLSKCSKLMDVFTNKPKLQILCRDWRSNRRIESPKELYSGILLKRCRSSRSQMFFKTGVLKILASFTGKLLCWSFFLTKLQAERDSNTGVFL